MSDGRVEESFYRLTPDQVLEGVEAAGFLPTGKYIQLNSYENRVFDLFLEKESSPQIPNDRLIAKYYRPKRWTEAAILEEHSFLQELQSSGIPVVAPLKQKNAQTLSHYLDIYLAVFPKALGRIPQELSHEELKGIGRMLARLHNVGAQKKARHRPTLSAKTYGWPALDLLQDWVAPELWSRYEKAAQSIVEYLEEHLDQGSFIRIHGDCHKGNLLRTDRAGEAQEFFFVDFDDFCNGPAVQDFWMLFSSDENDNQSEQEAILEGYEELREIDRSELHLMRPLRGLRIIHYAAWIARRWDDPTFPHLFPDFQEYTYWAEEVEALEKIAWSL